MDKDTGFSISGKTRGARMKQISILVLLVFLGTLQGLAQATPTTIKQSFPLALVLPNPCAPDVVSLTGNLELSFHSVQDPSGGQHFEMKFETQGITGVGLPSGNKYSGAINSGVRHHLDSTTPLLEFTFIDHFDLIAQKPGNNLVAHVTIHVTITPNGVPTAVVQDVRLACQ
jgi:hypothetical protein